MDTEWFAVDQDGNVGVFWSDEPGAVPERFYKVSGGQQHDGALEAGLSSLDHTTEAALDPAGLVHPGRVPGALPPRRRIPRCWPDRGDGYALVFREEPEIPQAVRDLPGLSTHEAGGFFVVTLAPDGKVEQTRERTSTWVEFLFASEQLPTFVTAASFLSLFGYARRGLFAFDADCSRFNIPEPYGRVLVPRRPVRLEELPAGLRARLERLRRLPVRFSELTHVQPAEHEPCETWESAVYLASDGVTVRAIPGREADFDDHACVLEDDAPDAFRPLVIEAPESEPPPRSSAPPSNPPESAPPPAREAAPRGRASGRISMLVVGALLTGGLALALGLGWCLR